MGWPPTSVSASSAVFPGRGDAPRRRVGRVAGRARIAKSHFNMPAIQLCDLPVDLLLTILVSCGPVATAHVAMVLPVLVRAQIDGKRLVDAIAVSLICTFSDALSCEYDARWPWLYHVARLMGLLPSKPHPVWLLDTAADVPRVPPSWFMRAVFCQLGSSRGTGFPIDLAVLRKMYAIFGMPYTDAAHSQPVWLRFDDCLRFPVISGFYPDWSPELAASPLGRFLADLERLLTKFQEMMFGATRFMTPYHVSSTMFDTALTSWASNAEGTSPWLLKEDQDSKDGDCEDDDSDDDGDSYRLETEDEDEVEEEYEVDEVEEVEEVVEEEHEYCMRVEGWDSPDLLYNLAFGHDGDPTCCHGPCRCTLIGPLGRSDRMVHSERNLRTGRRIGRYWDDDLRLARFLANPTCEKLSYFLDDGSDVMTGHDLRVRASLLG